MRKINYFRFATLWVAILLFGTACNEAADNKGAKGVERVKTEVPKAEMMAGVKADIQALESNWAAADNARDTNAIAAFYADDAQSFANNAPILVGKAAIRSDIAAGLAKREKGSTVVYTVLEVFGDENTAIELGTATTKNAAGKVVTTGKYWAIWEKRDGKYICIRDINNADVKAK